MPPRWEVQRSSVQNAAVPVVCCRRHVRHRGEKTSRSAIQRVRRITSVARKMKMEGARPHTVDVRQPSRWSVVSSLILPRRIQPTISSPPVASTVLVLRRPFARPVVVPPSRRRRCRQYQTPSSRESEIVGERYRLSGGVKLDKVGDVHAEPARCPSAVRSAAAACASASYWRQSQAA